MQAVMHVVQCELACTQRAHVASAGMMRLGTMNAGSEPWVDEGRGGRLDLATATCATARCAALPRGDRQEPGEPVAIRIERRDAFERPHQHFLRGVVDISIRDEAATERPNRGPRDGVQRIERVTLAIGGAREETAQLLALGRVHARAITSSRSKDTSSSRHTARSRDRTRPGRRPWR